MRRTTSTNSFASAIAGATAFAACAMGCHGTPPSRYTHAGGFVVVEKGQQYKWTFDESDPWKPGTGAPLVDPGPHRTFFAALGAWAIAKDDASPSLPNVYRQSKALGGEAQPRVIVGDLVFTDMTMRVKCRAESGTKGEACGVLFRAADSDNYFVARADALAGTIDLLRVIEGRTETVATAKADVMPWRWHTLSVMTKSDEIMVAFDGAPALYAKDAWKPGGKVGLWTSMDSVASFDDFEVRAE